MYVEGKLVKAQRYDFEAHRSSCVGLFDARRRWSSALVSYRWTVLLSVSSRDIPSCPRGSDSRRTLHHFHAWIVCVFSKTWIDVSGSSAKDVREAHTVQVYSNNQVFLFVYFSVFVVDCDAPSYNYLCISLSRTICSGTSSLQL